MTKDSPKKMLKSDFHKEYLEFNSKAKKVSFKTYLAFFKVYAKVLLEHLILGEVIENKLFYISLAKKKGDNYKMIHGVETIYKNNHTNNYKVYFFIKTDVANVRRYIFRLCYKYHKFKPSHYIRDLLCEKLKSEPHVIYNISTKPNFKKIF